MKPPSRSPAPCAQLLEHFASVIDPRIERTKEHLLIDIIALTICAVICGADGWVEVETYGNAKLEWLSQFLTLPNGIPSHDTLGRVFSRLDPSQLQDSFLSWVKAVNQLTQGQVIAIDGKTLRHSYEDREGKAAIHMVSAWATANRLVLGQRKVDDKSNEITAIPELLKVLSIEGCIITIDAMGCQTEIAQQIVQQDADYVLALKGNQGNLHEDVVQVFEHGRSIDFVGIEHDYYQSLCCDHGRTEIRRHWVLGQVEYLVDADRWVGLKRIGLVESERRLKDKTTIEQRYYLLSWDSSAAQFAEVIRSHWQIENCLHWVLDVGFREDECRIRKDYAPENMALIRHIALNLLTQDKVVKGGVKAKRLKAGWDNNFLLRLLAH
jgi:predicted transposase YbfD/YdcC